jgi:hypothetical protein
MFKNLLKSIKHRTLRINLNTNQMKKIHSRIQLSPTGKHWERWESNDQVTWRITHRRMTLDEALRKQQDVVLQNHKNLLTDILRKEKS